MEARGLASTLLGAIGDPLAVAPDGTVYAFGSINGRQGIVGLNPDGSGSAIAGGGSTLPQDGAPAVGTFMSGATCAVHPSGDIIVWEAQLRVIYRVHNGIIQMLAQNTGDVGSLAVTQDGAILFCNPGGFMTGGGPIMRIDGPRTLPQMIISTSRLAKQLIYRFTCSRAPVFTSMFRLQAKDKRAWSRRS